MPRRRGKQAPTPRACTRSNNIEESDDDVRCQAPRPRTRHSKNQKRKNPACLDISEYSQSDDTIETCTFPCCRNRRFRAETGISRERWELRMAVPSTAFSVTWREPGKGFSPGHLVMLTQGRQPFLKKELLHSVADSDCGDRPSKTYKYNFIHHDFIQIGKQYSRYKAICSSIVLSQDCCE